VARTNSDVLAALRKKLAKRGDPPVSLQAVQQRRSRLQDKVPMPTDIATYVVAQRAGVRLHQYLDADILDQVATAEGRLSAKEGPATAAPANLSRRAPRSTAITVKEVHLGKLKVPESTLSATRMAEAEKMAAVYPVLYAFENSMREFIDGHLTAEYGRDWWDDTKIVSTGVRANVDRARNAEAKNRYHSSRSARPIYYTNVGDLALITQSANGWKVFKKHFPSDKWYPGLVERIETSRNVVAHMNPLQKRDIDRINLNAEDWFAQIKGHEPASVPE
jgi:Swt1-like HEPN